jgi:hypothetical protein
LWREKGGAEGGETVCLDEDPVLIGINTRLGEAVKTTEKVWGLRDSNYQNLGLAVIRDER